MEQASDLESRGKWNDALSQYLLLYQNHPTNAEPLYRISKHYRLLGKSELSLIFAQMGLEVNDKATYHKLWEEISISAYYTKSRSLGLEACNRLLLDTETPGEIRNQVKSNLIFYVEPFSSDIGYDKIPVKLPEHYSAMNPCIIQYKDSYLLNCRTVNYGHKGHHYFAKDGTGIVRSKNYLMPYNTQLECNNQYEIIDSFPEMKSHVVGLEDLRIFTWKDELWYISNNRVTHDTPQLVLGRLEFKEDHVEVKSKVVLKGPRPESMCEKNWMYFVRNDELYFIYSHTPYIVLKCNSETGICTHEVKETKYNMVDFRGSCAPCVFSVEKTQGYLSLIHEVLFSPEERIYLHRFVWYNSEMIPEKMTLPFYFRHKGIEYSTGMCLSKDGKTLLLGLGVDDGEGYLAQIDVNLIRSRLS